MANIIFAALVTLALIAVTTTAWYVTQPLGYLTINISHSIINATTDLDSAVASGVTQTFNLERFALFIWGPLLDIVYVVFFVIFGTKVDTESDRRYYG